MSYLFDGANDKLERTATLPVTGYPFSVSLWVKPTGLGITDTYFVLGQDAVSTDFWTVQQQSSNLIRAITNDGGIANASTTTEVTAGNWHHVLAVFASTSSVSIYFDTHLEQVNLSPRNPAAPDVIRFGESPTGGSDFAGRLGEMAVWSSALTADDAVTLGLGAPPTEVGTPVAYWPLTADATDSIASYDLTATGAIFDADNPPVAATVADASTTGMIPIRVPWTSQPPPGTRIDTSHPLAKGLIFFTPCNEGGGDVIDNVTNARGADVSDGTSTAVRKANEYGRHLDLFRGGDTEIAGYEFASQKSWELASDEITVIAHAKRTAAPPTSSSRVIAKGDATFTTGWGIVLPDDTTVRFNCRAGGGNLNAIATTPTNINVDLFVAGRYDGANITVFARVGGPGNAVNTADTAETGTLNVDTNPIALGHLQSNRRSLTGQIYFTAIYDRVVPNADIVRLWDNPWQIYEPQTKWIPALLPSLILNNKKKPAAGAWTFSSATFGSNSTPAPDSLYMMEESSGAQLINSGKDLGSYDSTANLSDTVGNAATGDSYLAFTTANSDYATFLPWGITAYPFTLAVIQRFPIGDPAITNEIIGVADESVNDVWYTMAMNAAGRRTIAVRNTTQVLNTATPAINDDTAWHLWTAVYTDATTRTLQFDDIAILTGTTTSVAFNSLVDVGFLGARRTSSPVNYSNGDIATVMIWKNTALSVAQQSDLYADPWGYLGGAAAPSSNATYYRRRLGYVG